MVAAARATAVFVITARNHAKEERMFAAEHMRQKVRTEVELTLNDGTTLKGSLFTSPNERLIDTLNDARPFLPFEDSDGWLSVLNKTLIMHIRPIDQKPVKRLLTTEETPLHIGH